jgi:hypothetical protein
MGGVDPTHHFIGLFMDDAQPSIVAEKLAEAGTEIVTCLKSINFTNMMHLLCVCVSYPAVKLKTVLQFVA